MSYSKCEILLSANDGFTYLQYVLAVRQYAGVLALDFPSAAGGVCVGWNGGCLLQHVARAPCAGDEGALL